MISTYDRSFIRKTLIEVLEADTGQPFADLQDSEDLRSGLGLDSVDVVTVISQIERKFHIRMSHSELETLVTVGDVLTLLQRKIAEAAFPPAAAA